MPFLVLTLCLALGVWSVIALVRGSVFLSTALFLVSTSCLPAEFFAVDAAGLTWTLDRFWFLLLAAQVAIQWYRGELILNRLENVDVTIGLFALWLVARTMTQPLGAVLPGQPPTLMHLINGYLIPFALYAALRTTRLDVAKLKPALYLLIAMGCYLSLTAFLESIPNALDVGCCFPNADPQHLDGSGARHLYLGLFLPQRVASAYCDCQHPVWCTWCLGAQGPRIGRLQTRILRS